MPSQLPARRVRISNDITDLASGLDQPAPIPKLPALLNQIDSVIEQAVKDRNPDAGLNLISQLHELSRLSGLGLARALWKLGTRWRDLGMDSVFEDSVFTKTGLAAETTRRYVAVWQMFEDMDVDPQTKNELLRRPIRDLVAIAQAQARHGAFNARQLARLAKAEDNSTLRGVLADLTGRERGNSDDRVVLFLRRDGQLEVQRGRKRTPLGFIRKTPDDLADALRAEGIAALIERADILEE